MENQNVFILPLFSKKGNSFEIIEAYKTRYGFSHSDGVIIGGFKTRQDAENYCYIEKYNIINTLNK
jgi:hypothetical protein